MKPCSLIVIPICASVFSLSISSFLCSYPSLSLMGDAVSGEREGVSEPCLYGCKVEGRGGTRGGRLFFNSR
eukprot:scaffold73570_cov69-Phaeocystis_antarctica.AAC.1